MACPAIFHCLFKALPTSCLTRVQDLFDACQNTLQGLPDTCPTPVQRQYKSVQHQGKLFVTGIICDRIQSHKQTAALAQILLPEPEPD